MQQRLFPDQPVVRGRSDLGLLSGVGLHVPIPTGLVEHSQVVDTGGQHQIASGVTDEVLDDVLRLRVGRMAGVR